MNVKELSVIQQQALVDLVLLAMYADGHLASVEDVRVHRLLESLGHATEYDRNTQYDAAVGRISRHALTVQGAREHASALAAVFTTPQRRLKVHDLLGDLVTSDSKVSLQEGEFLAAVREALKC